MAIGHIQKKKKSGIDINVICTNSRTKKIKDFKSLGKIMDFLVIFWCLLGAERTEWQTRKASSNRRSKSLFRWWTWMSLVLWIQMRTETFVIANFPYAHKLCGRVFYILLPLYRAVHELKLRSNMEKQGKNRNCILSTNSMTSRAKNCERKSKSGHFFFFLFLFPFLFCISFRSFTLDYYYSINFPIQIWYMTYPSVSCLSHSSSSSSSCFLCLFSTFAIHLFMGKYIKSTIYAIKIVNEQKSLNKKRREKERIKTNMTNDCVCQ